MLYSVQIKKHIMEKSMNPKEIFDVLSSSSFERWWDKHFMDFISGEEDAKSKEQILTDIARMFFNAELRPQNDLVELERGGMEVFKKFGS